MDQREAELIVAREAERQKVIKAVKTRLFDKQLAVVDDPSMLRCVLGSRRIGKSTLMGIDLLITCIANPGCSAMYLALTKYTAVATMNRHIISPILAKHKIDATWVDHSMSWKFANGSILYMRGASASPQAIDRLVGQKFDGCVWIDEAGSQPRLETTVYEKILPAVAEAGGRVSLCGTPGTILDGLFYRASEGLEPGWSNHHWTWRDNPHVSHGKMKTTHDTLVANNPKIVDTPGYRREWLGKWAVDDTKLVYIADKKLNCLDQLPPKLSPDGWHYQLAVDIGYKDATAFVVSAWHDHDHHLYFLQAIAKPHMLPSDIEKTTKALWFNPEANAFGQYRFERMIIDTGGLGLSIAEQMRQRSGIPWIAASKTGKVGNIEIFNAALATGQVQILPGAHILFEEWSKLQWLYKRKNTNLVRIEHPDQDNHLSDAALYSLMAARNYNAMAAPVALANRADQVDKWASEYWAKEIAKQQRGDQLSVDQLPEDWSHYFRTGVIE